MPVVEMMLREPNMHRHVSQKLQKKNRPLGLYTHAPHPICTPQNLNLDCLKRQCPSAPTLRAPSTPTPIADTQATHSQP